MPPLRTAARGAVGLDGRSDIEPAAGALFAIIWDSLTEVLGTAAVAAIVRRAAGRAAAQSPELVELAVVRADFQYRYSLPAAWSRQTERESRALRVLVAEMGRLLVELTGTVVIHRLEQIPELRGRGLVWRTEGET
jgi:hypothetical protein